MSNGHADTSPPDKAECPTDLADRLWNRYEQFRSDDITDTGFLDTLSHLLLFKRADRWGVPRPGHPADPALTAASRAWRALVTAADAELPDTYQRVLEDLGSRGDTALAGVLTDAGDTVTSPILLRALIDDLDEGLAQVPGEVEAEGEILNVLLERTAKQMRGYGIHHTPRVLVDGIIEAVQPNLEDTIADPACGTAGFLVAAQRYIREQYGAAAALRAAPVREGNELSPASRFAEANLLLHNVGRYDDPALVTSIDPFEDVPVGRFSLILANPPFGRYLNSLPYRPDFDVQTRDRALNYLQHIMTALAPRGRAAVVLPDNALFEKGAAEAVRRLLLHDFDVHTLVRLPAGVFKATAVRTSVLFFDKPGSGSGTPATGRLWVYDLRAGGSFHSEKRPLRTEDLTDALEALSPWNPTSRMETPQFTCFTYEELISRENTNLDLTCPTSPPAPFDASPPEAIAREIAENLRAALDEFESIGQALMQDRTAS